MTDLKATLVKLNKNLGSLQVRAANFGNNVPVELLNQISGHQEAIALTPQLVKRLQRTVRKRVLRHLRRHGLLEPHEAEDMLA